MNFELIIHALDAKEIGKGRYMAKCPIHGDKTPSLLINENDDGSARFHCFGCGTADRDLFMDALGLDRRIAWPPMKRQTNTQWAQKSAYVSRVAAAIGRDIYQIRMICQDVASGLITRGGAIGRLMRMAPSVFYDCPRLDRDTRELAATARLNFWAAVIPLADKNTMIKLLEIACKPIDSRE